MSMVHGLVGHGSVGQWVTGLTGQWVNGLAGHWVIGSVGRGSMGQWVNGSMVNGSMGQCVSGSVGQWSMDQWVSGSWVSMSMVHGLIVHRLSGSGSRSIFRNRSVPRSFSLVMAWMQAIGSWPSSYVYSAYIDDRRAADVSHLIADSRPLLRVFSWLPRQMPATCHWRCLFWHRDHDFPLERSVIAWTDLDHFDSNRA